MCSLVSNLTCLAAVIHDLSYTDNDCSLSLLRPRDHQEIVKHMSKEHIEKDLRRTSKSGQNFEINN